MYLRIDKTVDEIAKMDFDEYLECGDKIEDYELVGDENVLIYFKDEGDGEEFVNIFSGIRIMITRWSILCDDRYRKLPMNIEYVIVDNKVYDVRDEFNMMDFMTKERLEEEIRKGRINESNKNGDTILIVACRNEEKELVLELIPRMTEEAISRWNEYGQTALYLACKTKMEEVAMEMIPRMTEEAINKVEIDGMTVIYWAKKK